MQLLLIHLLCFLQVYGIKVRANYLIFVIKVHRFTQMEKEALQNGKDLTNMTLQEMDAIWNTIKQKQRQQ